MTTFHDLPELFKRIPIALYRSAPDGALVEANPALATLLGFDSVEAVREHVTSVESIYVDPAQRARWIENIAEAGVIHDFDLELRRADGSTVWVRDSARVILDDAGTVVFYEGSLVDVTDKVDAERARDEFIAIVSHELRNPIAVMVGLGEELAQNYDSFSDIERREMAGLIARQAEDAGWLIEDLLVAYRDDIAQVMIAPRTFDLTKQVERVLEVVDHPIAIEAHDGSIGVHADPRRVRQILRNLVANALRYGGDEIAVALAKSGDRVEVQVRDSGTKISDADLEIIFRPFERGSGQHHPKSIGLGLSVSRRLARLMDGDLVYRHDGRWSTFVLSLPSG